MFLTLMLIAGVLLTANGYSIGWLALPFAGRAVHLIVAPRMNKLTCPACQRERKTCWLCAGDL